MRLHELAARCQISSVHVFLTCSLTCSGWMGGHSDLDLGNLGAGGKRGVSPLGFLHDSVSVLFPQFRGVTRWRKRMYGDTSELTVATMVTVVTGWLVQPYGYRGCTYTLV